MAVKYGNPRFLSIIVVSSEGMAAFSTKYIVFTLNVRFFTSEKASSLGTLPRLEESLAPSPEVILGRSASPMGGKISASRLPENAVTRYLTGVVGGVKKQTSGNKIPEKEIIKSHTSSHKSDSKSTNNKTLNPQIISTLRGSN
ncbi:hypothetical protein L1987_22907 [Smallanthus sonchifolius]|uniref:Uncharacterized protein n=1 Tax=Smallanthus sonchifolius TaxID=185202 RepID=A0ACB9IGQ4_9ASTR|nr:hypothetical protein L1987_22907 [Smallanthus sonchifolius]